MALCFNAKYIIKANARTAPSTISITIFFSNSTKSHSQPSPTKERWVALKIMYKRVSLSKIPPNRKSGKPPASSTTKPSPQNLIAFSILRPSKLVHYVYIISRFLPNCKFFYKKTRKKIFRVQKAPPSRVTGKGKPCFARAVSSPPNFTAPNIPRQPRQVNRVAEGRSANRCKVRLLYFFVGFYHRLSRTKQDGLKPGFSSFRLRRSQSLPRSGRRRYPLHCRTPRRPPASQAYPRRPRPSPF